jgi:hypothetical protein
LPLTAHLTRNDTDRSLGRESGRETISEQLSLIVGKCFRRRDVPRDLDSRRGFVDVLTPSS